MAQQKMNNNDDDEDGPDQRFLSWNIYLEPNGGDTFVLSIDIDDCELIISQNANENAQKYPFNNIASTFPNQKNSKQLSLMFKSNKNKSMELYFDSEYDRDQIKNVIGYGIKGKNKLQKKAKKFGLMANYELGCQKKTVMKWQPRIMSLIQHRVLLFINKDEDPYPCSVISLADPNISIHQVQQYPCTIQFNTGNGLSTQFHLGDDGIMKDLNDYIEGVLNKVNQGALQNFDKTGFGKQPQMQQQQQQQPQSNSQMNMNNNMGYGNQSQQQMQMQGSNMNMNNNNMGYNNNNMGYNNGSQMNMNMNQQQQYQQQNMQMNNQSMSQFKNPYGQSQMSFGQQSSQIQMYDPNSNINYGSDMNLVKKKQKNNVSDSKKPKLTALPFTQKYKRKKAVLYMWGKARPANIYPSNADRLQPYEHESLTKKKIYFACAAKEGYTAFGIGQNDWLFTWGQSKFPGALGLGNKNKTTTPFLVRALKKNKIFTVACASTHGFCIDTQGIIYGWGNKQLTLLQQDTLAPTIVPQIQNLNINNIVCCDTHNLGWNPESITVHAWGLPGPWLGLGDSSQQKQIPYGIMEFDDEIKSNDQFAITHCSISSQYSLILLNTGYVGACGINEFGRMGSGKDIQESWSILWNPDIKDIVNCSAGPFHSAFCDTKGDCFTVGQGKDYRCSSTMQTTYQPKIVEQIANVRIVRVECSDARTYVISSEGHLIMWGKEPVTGRIHANPFYFEYLSAYRIYDIICAKDFNIAIANPSKSPIERPDLKEIEVDSSIHVTKETNQLNAMIANVVETGHKIGQEQQYKVDQIFGGFVSVTKDIPDPDSNQAKMNKPMPMKPNDPMAAIMMQMQGMGLNANGSQPQIGQQMGTQPQQQPQYEMKQQMQQKQQMPMQYGNNNPYQQQQQQRMQYPSNMNMNNNMGYNNNPNNNTFQGQQQNYNMSFNGGQKNIFANNNNPYGGGSQMSMNSQYNNNQYNNKPMNYGNSQMSMQSQQQLGNQPTQVYSGYKKPKINAAPNPFK